MKNVLIDPSNERKIVDFRELGFSDVMALGRYSYVHAHEPLKRHSHGDMIEVTYLDVGNQIYEVKGKEYVLKGGDLFVTFPHEMHGSGSSLLSRARSYWMLIALPSGRERFLNLSPQESRDLIGRLLNISYRHFKGGALFKEHLENIFKTYDNDESSLKVAGLKNQMLRFLLDVLERAEHHARAVISPAVVRVQDYIKEHIFEEPPLISELAEVAGLSESRFKARFKNEVGISPRGYIITLKMEKAKELLAQSTLSVTEIAMELGFSSSPYFATVFKQFTRMKPLEWRSESCRLRRPST